MSRPVAGNPNGKIGAEVVVGATVTPAATRGIVVVVVAGGVVVDAGRVVATAGIVVVVAAGKVVVVAVGV